MKYLKLTLFLGFLAFLVSCKNNETEYLFEKPITVRTADLAKKYTDILTKPEFGWVAHYSPNGKNGTNILLLKFDKEGNVVMQSDYQDGRHNNTITYRIDKTMKMELVFETNSVLHAIYEVNNNNNNGEYVFNILDANDEQVHLESKTDNGYGGDVVTQLRIKPATESDWDLSAISRVFKEMEKINFSTVWKIASADGVIANISFFEHDRRVGISRQAFLSYVNEKNEGVTGYFPVSITSKGFCFRKPIQMSGKKVECFTWNDAGGYFENTEIGLKIQKSLQMPRPMGYYNFENPDLSNKRMMITNKGATSKSKDQTSPLFIKMHTQFTENFKTTLGKYEVKNIYISLRNIQAKEVLLEYYIMNPEKDSRRPDPNLPSSGVAAYLLNYSITTDEKGQLIKFKFTNRGNTLAVHEAFFPLLKPMIALLTDEEGFYLQKCEKLNKEQNTFALISARNPEVLISWYDF